MEKKLWKAFPTNVLTEFDYFIDWKSEKFGIFACYIISLLRFTILPKVLVPPSNERFDYFSNFHEYKS